MLNPHFWPDLRPGMIFSYGVAWFYALLIALTALNYAPRLTLWAGIASLAIWLAGSAWMLLDPDTLSWRVQHGMHVCNRSATT